MPSPTTALSDQRVADAVRVAPYLTHVVRHHGQLTLIPPDNAGRIRKPKREKREKGERRTARNEEPQFNTGVSRAPRRRLASPSSRTRLQDRRRNGAEGDMHIPDYPPPSFDEAVSTASSVALPLPGGVPAADPAAASSDTVSSTAQTSTSPSSNSVDPPTTSGPSTSAIPRTRSRLTFASPAPSPSSPSSPSASSDPRYSTQADYNPSESDSDSDSDIGSLEFVPPGASQWEEDRIQGLTLEERVAREHERQHHRSAVSDVASSIARALRPSRSQLTIVPTKHTSERQGDNHDESTSASASSPSPSSPHGRNASPSPARSSRRRLHLFASGSKDKERQPSSLPSSPSSPAFSSSQMSPPFHAITHPGLPAAKSQSSRGEGFLSRRIFGHKGKEKERRSETPPIAEEGELPEPLEEWEVLDQSFVPSDIPGRRSVPPPARPNPSPERMPKPPPSPSAPSILLNGNHSPPRPKRHSMHDRPAPLPPPTFVERASVKPPPPPPPPSVTMPITSATREPSPTRSVRTQHPSNEDAGRPSQHHEIKPSASMIYLRDREAAPISPASTRSAVTHLEFNSPATPTSPQFFIGADGVLRRGTPVPAVLLSTPHHVPIPAPAAREADHPVPAPVPPATRLRHFVPPMPSPLASRDDDSLLELYDHTPMPTNAIPASPTPSTAPEPYEERSGESVSAGGSSRHHYPGRPLPLPPGPSSNSGSRSPVRRDSAPTQRVFEDIAGATIETSAGPINPSAIEAYNVSLPPSPPIQSAMASPVIASPSPSSRSRTPPAARLLRPEPDIGAGPPTPSVYEETEQDRRAGEGGYSQYTELDVLLARLDNGAEGQNYDDLLLIADVMGPASSSDAPRAPPDPPIGPVHVVRRRVMRDGRVKLKLDLLGASVDRCGICMSQFREAQSGARGPACGHAFHETCLRSWFARGSRACPLCRAQFE